MEVSIEIINRINELLFIRVNIIQTFLNILIGNTNNSFIYRVRFNDYRKGIYREIL
jgi:hypothetical protein